MEHKVIIDGVRYVEAYVFDGDEESTAIGVGNFVRLAGDTALDKKESYLNNHMYGRVLKIDVDGHVAVEFSRYNRELHNLGGLTQNGHGYWFLQAELVKEL